MSKSLSSPNGGYRWLDVWALACVIQLGTQRFCLRHLDRSNDPCGRLHDQMAMAARSVPANIAEGYARRSTSAETQRRLYDVARASLAELAGDFRNFLVFRRELPWSETDPEERAVFATPLDKPAFTADIERALRRPRPRPVRQIRPLARRPRPAPRRARPPRARRPRHPDAFRHHRPGPRGLPRERGLLRNPFPRTHRRPRRRPGRQGRPPLPRVQQAHAKAPGQARPQRRPLLLVLPRLPRMPRHPPLPLIAPPPELPALPNNRTRPPEQPPSRTTGGSAVREGGCSRREGRWGEEPVLTSSRRGVRSRPGGGGRRGRAAGLPCLRGCSRS